jgi:hypothetical protein
MNRRKQKECAEQGSQGSEKKDRRDQRKKIAGIRRGRIASSDGEKIDRDGGWTPHGGIFTVFLTSTVPLMYRYGTEKKDIR